MATFTHYQPPPPVTLAARREVLRPTAHHPPSPIFRRGFPHGLRTSIQKTRDGVEAVKLPGADNGNHIQERRTAEDGRPGAGGKSMISMTLPGMQRSSIGTKDGNHCRACL